MLYLTVVAVDALSRITGVGVGLEVALGELEVLARNDGVQGEGGAGEDFAGVAVAQDSVLAGGRMLVSCIRRESEEACRDMTSVVREMARHTWGVRRPTRLGVVSILSCSIRDCDWEV